MDDFIFEQIALNSRDRNFGAAIKAKEKLYDSADIEVYDTEAFGRCVYLNGSLQLCEKFEHIYHESIVNPCLWNIPKLEKVLIIGGGDGGTLREVLKYQGLKRVVMCEILPEFVEVAKAHLPFTKIEESLKNPIVELIFDDGAKYISKSKETFDAIIIDCSDPHGPAEVLYSRSFIKNCRMRLSEGGGFAIQAMNAFVRPKFARSLEYELRREFGAVHYLFAPMPSYVTGGIGFMFASDRNYKKNTLPDDLKFITPRVIEAGMAISHDIFYQNDVGKVFDMYCEKFYDWKTALTPTELEYVTSSFCFENEPVNSDGMLKHIEFGASVIKGGAGCEFLTVMTEENEDELEPILKEIVKTRKPKIPKGFKVKGLRFCSMFKTVSFIISMTLEELKIHYPGFYENRPERCHDRIFVHIAQGKTGKPFGLTAVYGDLSRRYYRTDVMNYEADIIWGEINVVRAKLNSYGKVMIDAFGREGVRPHELVWKDKDCYDLSFAL